MLLVSGVFRFSESEDIKTLLARNRAWAQRLSALRPGLFPALAESQHPHILWIGCSDSRVPETSILDLLPGEVFVHRNIANVLPYGDLSSMSVIQYALEHLGVRHIIVCGHHGCGGVMAALGDKKVVSCNSTNNLSVLTSSFSVIAWAYRQLDQKYP